MTSFHAGPRKSVLSRTFSRHGQDDEEARAVAVAEALHLARGKGLLPSPTELVIDLTRTCKTLTPLRWHHWDHTPYKMKLTNTGCTVMVSAKWRSKERAHLTGGPLLGRYVFSQLHFHWGEEDNEGSEHTLEGESFPLEMHMVLFKSRYLTQEAALKELDGVVEVAYFFELSKNDNPMLEPLVQSMPKVKCAMKSTRIGPVPLSQLVPSFPTDYLLYMGSLLTGKCAHALTWIVHYQPLSISKRQLKALRSVHGLDGTPLVRNWRKAHPPMGRTVLHVLPANSKITHRGDRASEAPRESRHSSRFSPDWTEENEPYAPPPEEEPPKKGRRFFGCFGKKNQDAPEELMIVGSSGDSETTDTSSNQLRLPRIASQKSFCHPKVSESTFRAMCQASHLLSMSSSSQHSSTAGEDADSRRETSTTGYTERCLEVINGTKHEPLDEGTMLLQQPELRGREGAPLFNLSERRPSFGVTFLDQNDHRREFIRPFNTFLSEVEEEPDRTNEGVGDAAGNDGGRGLVAPEKSGLLHRRLPPLTSPPSIVENKELSTMKGEQLDVIGNGDARLSFELSTCSLNMPESPPDSLIFDLSSPTAQYSDISLLTVVHEDTQRSVKSDGEKLSPNDERAGNVISGASKLIESIQRVEDIPAFHRYCKQGISWWVPFDFTSDSNGNDAEGSSRDAAQPYPISKLSTIPEQVTANCFLEEEIFTDTSTTTDTPRTAITPCSIGTDVVSDSNQSTAQQNSEEQEPRDSIQQSQIPDPGVKDMKNISAHRETLGKNANASPTGEKPSISLYPDVATNVYIFPEEANQRNDTWSPRTRVQKRSDEEELRFPQIKIPKRKIQKAKAQKKKTSLSMSSLQDMQQKNTSHSVYQRTTKDGKVKDRLNSWREMQSRKRTSRKSENKKRNRSSRRHHSSSSMDHFILGSSSDDQARLEKKVSKSLIGLETAKTSNTVFADGKLGKDGYECQRRDRSNSSSSVSSIFSNNDEKCIAQVVTSGGIQELLGSGDEMQLQEISFHYAPFRAGAAPQKRKLLIATADHGDSAIGKSPSTLRLHLKAPVDMSQLLKKVPSGSYITVDGPGAYAQEREITVGMVLVDTLKCQDGRETNYSSAEEVTSVEAPQNPSEKSEGTPVEKSKNLSTSAPAGDCGIYDSATVSKQKSDVVNTGANQMETFETAASNLSAIEGHCHCRNRCCNAECWICQLSTIKVIQYTQGLDSSRDLTTSEHSEGSVVDAPSAMKPGGNEDEIAAVANVSSIAVQRFSPVFSRTLGFVHCSGSNERVPVPEPVPVGDVPLQDNLRAGVELPTSQNEITEVKSKETGSVDPKVYRTTMELRLYRDGIVLGENSNTSSSGGERMVESSETSKEVLPEGQKEPQMGVHDANSSSCEETNNNVQLLSSNNENKGTEGAEAEASTEIIDIYRKTKRRPQRKKFTVGGNPETLTMMGGLSSYTSCATESDVSLIPEEDEAVPQPSNTQSFAPGEEIPTKNQEAKCTEMGERDGGNSISYQEHKSTLRRFRLEYELLSKVILYATLHKLGITSRSVASTAGDKPCPENQTGGSNQPDCVEDSLKPPLCTEVVKSLSKVPSSHLEDSNTKSTWTGPEGPSTTASEHSAAQQALPVTLEAESQRETEDTQERQQPVADGSGGIGEKKCSKSQLLAATPKPETNSRTLCTSGSVTLYTKNGKLLNVFEENTSNDTEVESIADSQETRYIEGVDFSSASMSSNTTRKQPKNRAESCKTPSIASSANRPKMCSVEVRQKGIRPGSEPLNMHYTVSKPKKSYRPGGEPQQVRKPKKHLSKDRILSPREVYERRKMYAQSLALRRAQKANQACSEDGERPTNIDENQSVSEGKSVGEPSQKQCRSKNIKLVDDYQSVRSVKLGGAGNKSASAGKGTTVKSYMDNKARGMVRMPENIRARRGASSCSTGSTRTNSVFCGTKERTVTGGTSLRNDNKLGGARDRSLRKSVIHQWKGDSVKEEDETSTIANSENSEGSPDAYRTPGAVAVSGSNGMKPSWILGDGLKSNTANDVAERTPAPSRQRCATEKQSKKTLLRKTSALGAVVLHGIGAIDKPSLCEMWVKQHYSDSSTVGSPCGSVCIETAVQTAVRSTKKPGTNLIDSGNATVDSEKSSTPNVSLERLKNQVTSVEEREGPAIPIPQPSLPLTECKVSAQPNGEQILPFGAPGMLMIPFRTDAVPLLTYKPQIFSSDCLKSPQSDHVQETGLEKRPTPTVNSLRTLVSDSPSPRKDVGGKRKKAKPLTDKSHKDSATGLSQPSSVHDRKSVATSPMPLRKNASHQMSLTVEEFSFCSTGVNTSLSVTHLSSRSMAVQCPSQTLSERPSATTDHLQSTTESELKRETQIRAASGMSVMLTEVATKLESEVLVQKSVATQWLRHASVPNLALKSPEKKTGKQTNRGSSNKRSALGEYDLGINQLQMATLRLLHRRRMFRAFSTNSLVLGTNEANAKKVMRRLFRKKKKKVKPDGTGSKSKCRHKKKEEGEVQAATSGSGACSSAIRTGDTTDRSARSSGTRCDLLSDSADGAKKNQKQKLSEADQKSSSRRLLLVRGSETPQSPALFEDLEGCGAAGLNWCSVHNRPAEGSAADADSDEVSAAVAQVNTGARVLRVSLADEESTGCADLGSVEFVVRGADSPRQPTATPSVLARLRQMLTWRT